MTTAEPNWMEEFLEINKNTERYELNELLTKIKEGIE